MENLMIALNTARIFLTILDYTTNIDDDFLSCQNFRHQKKNFNILNKDQEVVGNISYYDFNQKILISLGKENGKNSYPLGRWDIAVGKPHTLRGYFYHKPKEHLALEMVIDYPLDFKLLDFTICFKGEYLMDNQHIAFAIKDNNDFLFVKNWLNNKEIIKLNINDRKKTMPLLKHTLFSNHNGFMIKEEKIYEEALKLKGYKDVRPSKEEPKIWTFSLENNNLIQSLGVFMKILNPHYQENMIIFNQNLNGLLGRFLGGTLNYSPLELEILFGFTIEKIEIKDDFCLTRRKNYETRTN